MTVSFDPTMITPVSRVRQLIGDTDITNAQIQDETINFYLGQGKSEFLAASQLAYDLAAKYARMADVNVDDQLTKASHLFQHYTDLAKRLAEQDTRVPPTPNNAGAFGGGIMPMGIGDCRGLLDDCCASPYWRQ